VQNATYQALGGFRPSARTTCDFEMSIRLLSRYGVRCVLQTTAAYTAHGGGITTTGFTPQIIALTLQHFEMARATGVLDAATVYRLRRRWFHQFILAGTWRGLKDGDRIAARRAYALFDLPDIRAHGISLRWLPVRLGMAVLSGALWNSALAPERAAPHRTATEMTREW
jgi:hypothetical protein